MTNPNALAFGTAFESLTGHAPFPWQECLFGRFVEGDFPTACDIPTGLGKTSVVAVWLIALASLPDKLPRRLVYVVNRRTVVDQTTVEVRKLRDKILNAGLQDRLSRLCAIPLANNEPALAISTLRGQFADNREWLTDPARPAVIVGTVDMIGSRLLFSGYRAGSWQLARHAGLMGQDALLVHDEAHLEPSFQKLINWIDERQKFDSPLRRLRVMAMSATSRSEPGRGMLTLSDQDRQHAAIKQRFSDVQKVLSLYEPDSKKLLDQLVELAWRHAGDQVRVIVYVRQPERAGKVRDALLAKLGGQTDAAGRVALLTGTIRGHERDHLLSHPAVHGLLHSHDDRGQRITPSHTTWMVATSAGEVGADFDADHLVCDLAPIDSMIQRFGRVNRRGGTGREARIDVVLDRPEANVRKNGSAKNLSELDQARLTTADLLAKLPQIEAEMDTATNAMPLHKASPEALRNLASSRSHEYAKACSPEPPFDTPHDVVLDAWSLTSIQDDWTLCHDVHPYLHGLDDQAPETIVAWRTELAELPNDADTSPEDIEETMRDVLRHYPLRPVELLREKSLHVAELLVAAREREPKAWIVLLHQRFLSSLRLENLKGDAKAIAPQLYYRTVLLPPSLGGLNTAGMLEEPDARARQVAAVRDVADLAPSVNGVAQPLVRRRVVLTRDDDNQWRDHILSREGPADISSDDESAPTYPKWTVARDALAQKFNMAYEAQCLLANDDAGPTDRLLFFQARQASQATGAIQRVTIEDHNAAVEMIVVDIQQRLQLPSPLDRAFQAAGSAHDLGKADRRWQEAIGNGDGQDRLAKSCGHGFNWRALSGYRHEFGSLRAVVQKLPDDEARDLVLHLIATHHGRGRPHFEAPAMADEHGLSDNLHGLLQPAEVARRFARLQRRYGHWGLAWLETILMAADAAGSQLPVEVAADQAEEDEE
ncbi:MAG TPA: type I-U CRISPR-associated helicase/endonuclease Cas3 [Pirellulales bacterium]|jgi:CRISPR-associated endonuclease/helicase Cas3|nr:type I-U CRISPR-associated helicase/endonuclease Cas3 [Pirellulales bacterium]